MYIYITFFPSFFVCSMRSMRWAKHSLWLVFSLLRPAPIFINNGCVYFGYFCRWRFGSYKLPPNNIISRINLQLNIPYTYIFDLKYIPYAIQYRTIPLYSHSPLYKHMLCNQFCMKMLHFFFIASHHYTVHGCKFWTRLVQHQSTLIFLSAYIISFCQCSTFVLHGVKANTVNGQSQ